ncbi:MAG: S41 family peptidase, partial [Cocleimonas sp.]
MWLRSWSEDVYLWYRELADTDTDTAATPREYFGTLKTNATTPSGTPRDQFHFFVDTAENEQQVSTGSSVSYGMTFRLLESSPPRKAVVLYVEPGSSADLSNVVRGSEITTVDGADLIFGNDIDTLNNGLFPRSANENHSFTLVNPGSTTSRTVTLNSSVIAENPVQNTTFFTNSATNERVGYLTFNTFGTFVAEESLTSSFAFLADTGVSDLVLDLRYNGGGFLAISSQLAYMIAGPSNTTNRTYYKPVFNDKYPDSDPVSGNPIQEYPFYNTGLNLTVSSNTALPTLNLDRVFVLTTASTCSASEALINGLQGIGVEVIQIGEKTCG